jgi:hypothetical protein
MTIEYRIQNQPGKNGKESPLWLVQQYELSEDGAVVKTTGVCATASKEWALKIAGALSMQEDV